MIEVRFGFFETNSSSVHALVIPKDTKLYIPNTVHLQTGEYGWSCEKEYNTLDYLYTACATYGKDEVNKLIAYLHRKGVENVDCHEGDWYYVDHAEGIPFSTLFTNENLLDRFLFGEDSYVQMGNDNSDGENPHEYPYDSDKYDVLIKYN